MIKVEIATALMLYLLLTLGSVLGLWGYQHYKLRCKKIAISKDELLVCEFCHFAYLADRAKKVTKCPSCSSYNKNNQFS